MADYELFQIEITKNYTFNDWRDDIRRMMRKAGEEGVSMVFLFGDHQIKEEAFLEDVTMLLNTGDIPNLYENEERLEIIEKVCNSLCVHWLCTPITFAIPFLSSILQHPSYF